MNIRFTTAGESHGKALTAILEGIPSGLGLSKKDVDVDLRRRMMGYGRGARMKIESDEVEFLGGVRAGQTLGSPISMLIRNRDWENWSEIMDAESRSDDDGDRRRKLGRPRPGHADLVGVLKYNRSDARDILERASARETASRVACGAVCRKLLVDFGVTVGSHVVEIGPVKAPLLELPDDLNSVADRSEVRCIDEDAGRAMIEAIDRAREARDTLGGIVEVVVKGLPVGLGSHVSWHQKLDGRLAHAMMSIPAVKGVELGLGFEASRRPGSKVHDELFLDDQGIPFRKTNNAGGTEGGMTTGGPLVIRVGMKPISTLMKPLASFDLDTGETARAQAERSDTTAVPALGVISEAMAAIVVANALSEQFGGGSMTDLKENVNSYMGRVESRWKR